MRTVALIGNPNCGKTTLFNALTGGNQAVGNWPGVTVEKKEGWLRGNRRVRVLDLPGVYSLTPFAPEEAVARNALAGKDRPDVVLNVADGTNLERGLYLTLQLLEMGLPVVLAVNCMDVLQKRGDRFAPQALEAALGIRVVPVSAAKGQGVAGLARLLTQPTAPSGKDFFVPREEEAAIAWRYACIEDMVPLCLRKSNRKDASRVLDNVLLHRWLALPIFIAAMCLVYYVSVAGPGGFLAGLLEGVLDGFGRQLETWLLRWEVAPVLRALVLDGLLRGVGTVLGFAPQMLCLFACLAFLEDCGYLARIAFVLDCLLRRFGLSGKCFVPMLLATGCGVPAILSVRAIDSPRERRVTAATCTFLPCSAKLPVIALMGGAFFGGAWWLSPLLYFVGFAAILFSGWGCRQLERKTKHVESPFLLELPQYRLPRWGSLAREVGGRTGAFLKKAGTVILLSSLVVWFLMSFRWQAGRFVLAEGISQGLLAWLGRRLEPLFAPLGFGQWQAVAATITALVAKENAVSTLGILYPDGIAAHFSAAAALSFLLFNLLCAPCVAAVAALRRTLGRKGAALAVAYQCAFAYAVAATVWWVAGR